VDLLSDLIHGNTGENALSDTEIVVLVAGLVAAGSETTTLGGTQVLRHLLAHPAELAKLRADPSLARNAVREALRFDFGSLAAVNMRFAMEDIPLHGKTIRKHDMIMLSPASANRDPAVFPDPDRFDITRDTSDVVSFGHGPRYCLGANLAMQEMSCMLEAALDFLPESAELVESASDWEQIGIMRRPLRLVVDLGRR
jgi:cytochrome P450